MPAANEAMEAAIRLAEIAVLVHVADQRLGDAVRASAPKLGKGRVLRGDVVRYRKV